ncbi:MAG: hypothetical protein ABR568_17860 [Pyrinomonadaceae bacterium]
MKKNVIVVVVVLTVLLLGAAYRVVHVFPYPIGGGQHRESPDKKFTASASSMTDRFFFGGERRYFEFDIEVGSRQKIRRIVIDEPPEGMIDWRAEGSIEWAADSSSVTYSFKGTQLILSVKS